MLISKNYYTCQPLWDSAREELVCFFAGSAPMFGLAVCSVQFSVHPVPPGHIVEIHTGIKGVLMFGDENLARPTSTLANRHFKRRLLTLVRDLQRCEIPWILAHLLT